MSKDHTTALPPSFLSSRLQILSGSALKMIAVITMLIDHSACILLSLYPPALTPLFHIGQTGYSLYRICRDIGRIAFPIYCFLLLEGFLHTRNRKKYGRNLLIFALISELPWNYMFADTWHYEKQNVFFTLLLGYLAFCALEYFKDRRDMQLLSMIGLLAVSVFLKADYSCWLAYEWKACFAFLPINMYNGQRGFIRGKAAKYFFYAFYPLHIVILVILRRILF